MVEAQLTCPVAAASAVEDALPRTTPLKKPLGTAGTTLLDRDRDAGAVRPDLAAADLVPLMCGIAPAAHVHGERIDTGHRYLTTLPEGMCPVPPRA
ncbi:hypothetical protein [Streptomyces sp. NPDC006147]|uniref:SbtR family transcriptional regulator n=1 Tax=unclassified Streptomyces TaxID=2593676 RepID=UPI0033BBC5E3